MSYDKRIPIRLTSDQLRLIDEATKKSYHSKRSDWLRAAIISEAERQLAPLPDKMDYDPRQLAKWWKQFLADKRNERICQQDADES